MGGGWVEVRGGAEVDAAWGAGWGGGGEGGEEEEEEEDGREESEHFGNRLSVVIECGERVR